MAFRVELTRTALANLEAIFESIHADSSELAFRWFNGLERAILSLRESPDRGSRTPESESFRHLLYGTKPHFYRIIYSVHREEGLVRVHHIRHGARSTFGPADLA